ncbi:hypothetical protein J6524_29815 [Bradyrhizobium sp. WSM 1738]|uniref:hypothetical protein n=1 Tax=Bradyrhizobium hereditatis TaxID=2821405 RepID=UPI001CE34F3B|nr:hypothetical protein [Bradyrhizobium hereditatis]MCA6119047.1 hypothetical protein [Bradyrhizobium hereditatis]
MLLLSSMPIGVRIGAIGELHAAATHTFKYAVTSAPREPIVFAGDHFSLARVECKNLNFSRHAA